jgi:hypothetical protein
MSFCRVFCSFSFNSLPLCESISQGIQESRPDFRSFVGLLDNTAYLFEWSRCSVMIGRISPILTIYSHVRLSTSWQHVNSNRSQTKGTTIDGSIIIMECKIISPYATFSTAHTHACHATRKRSQFLVVQKTLIAPSTTHHASASPSRSTSGLLPFSVCSKCGSRPRPREDEDLRFFLCLRRCC